MEYKRPDCYVGLTERNRKIFQMTKPFAQPDDKTAWKLLAITFGVYFVFFTAVVIVDYWLLKLFGSVIIGLTSIRIFIFFHDSVHQAIFKGSRLGKVVTYLIGIMSCTTPGVWREFHHRHHRINGLSMDHLEPGIRPGDMISRLVNVNSFPRWPRIRQWIYRVARHPLIFPFGWLINFVLGAALIPAIRDFRNNGIGLLILTAHFSWLFLLYYIFGLNDFIWLAVLPTFISLTTGSWIFYVQHAVPGVEYQYGPKIDLVESAIKGSSYFRMNKIMHWFTGNIGYHNVHHLNAQIPFWRLPEVMKAIPELEKSPNTSWHPQDIFACLSIHAWNNDTKKAGQLPEINIV